MPAIESDDSREERIELEAVDACNAAERAMVWYYYLDNHLNFPFKALWTSQRRATISTDEEVEVVGMSPEEYCLKEMFIELLYKEGTVEDTFSVPLFDIEGIDAAPKIQEAIADWHYWVNQGYEL